MDNKDFDKIFSDKLGEEQGFGFRESDWDEIAEVVQQKKATGLVWWKWLFPVLFLAFSGTIYCLVSELNETRDEVHLLRNNIVNQQQTNQAIEKTDTNYQTITIFAYDTIYKKIVVEENISNRVSAKNISLDPLVNMNNQPDVYHSKRNLPEKRNDLNLAFLNSASEEKSIELIDPKLKVKENLIEYSAVDLLSELGLSPVKIQTKTKKQPYYLYNITTVLKKIDLKNRLKVGFTNAWGIAENKSNSYFLKNGNSKKFMLDLGIRAEWAFSKRIRGTATLMVDQIYLKTTELDSSITELVAPDELGTLTAAKVRQTAVQHELGLKYLIQKNKKWTPYGGISIAFQSNLNHKLEVNYHYVYQESNIKNGKIKTSDFKLNSMNYFWGYEYQFSNQFSWQVEQWFRYNFNKTDAQMYSNFGIRNTILYHF